MSTIKALLGVSAQARDQKWLMSSLQAAIELEVSTLPPYLCGMWSIRNEGDPVYELILGVAFQEMAHLGLVCNMLVAIGGTPEIAKGYAKQVKYPGPLPGGVRPGLIVSLAGLTKPYLHDVYMEIEFPENPVRLESLEAETFPTIGEFYDAVQDAFKQLKPALILTNQVASGIGVNKLTTLKDVNDAIELIKLQGEGSSTSPFDGSGGELAHYYRFAQVYVGAKLMPAAAGAFSFTGAPIPFPDTFTMPAVPVGGWPNPKPSAAKILNVFDSVFSDMLDDLDQAWRGGALRPAVARMLDLREQAIALMGIPLPNAADGVYGPQFKYIPVAQRTKPGPQPQPTPTPAPGDPKFADVVALLKSLTGDQASGSPHGTFWHKDYDAFLAQRTDNWGPGGPLVVKGDSTKSNLYLALSGTGLFANLRMPPGNPATAAQLDLVKKWIDGGCPNT